jgi:uncharacterized membrane protein YbhN (UPF0104 family)
VDALVRAADAFFGYLDTIAWSALALALGCHLAKMAARARSWRNIVAASYPEAEVRWRSVFGGYVAGVGVNALVPARGGDLLKLYIVKHRVRGATYPTLAATLVVETLFDFVVASALVAWALYLGVLPGLDAVPRLPTYISRVDWLWLVEHPGIALLLAMAVLLAAVSVGVWASKHVVAFRRRVAQGFAILRPPTRYLRAVVPWQLLDWVLRLATVYFFLVAFGLVANLHNALLVQVTQSLATILPLTPAGIGTEQALLVYVFASQAPFTTVLSFSVGMKIVLIAANVAIGFTAVALMLRTFRWRRAVAGDAAQHAAETKAAR